MMKLNDRAIQMHGYAQRTTNEWPAVGLSVPAWMSDFSNRLMVQGGANLVRWMHVTPWKQDVESCDRVGLLQAMPAGDSEGDVTGRRWDLRLEVMRDAIIYNRNNPSVIFYEAGNKGVRDEHMAQMKALRRCNTIRMAGALRVQPRNAEQQSRRLRRRNACMSTKARAFRSGRWSIRVMKACANTGTNSVRRSIKKALGPPYKGENASGYNHNQDAHAIEDVVRWYDFWRERPGTGARVSDGGVNIIFSDSNTHHRGESNYRTSGEVDAMRLPKDGFFADQVMWDGWVNVEHPRAHIIGHWNYAPGTKKPITVVCSAAESRTVSQRPIARLRRAEQTVFCSLFPTSPGKRARCAPLATMPRAQRCVKTAKSLRARPPRCD